MTRTRMRMRAFVQRDTRVTNDYGDEGIQDWQVQYSSLPCHAWNKKGESGGKINFGEPIVSSNYFPVMIVPVDSDIKETDRVYNIKNKRDKILFGTMDITAVLRRSDHLEVRMKDHA